MERMRRSAMAGFCTIAFIASAAGAADRITPEQWNAGAGPLPAVGDVEVSEQARLAREAILGPDATERGKVQLWWYGVSSFIASIDGHLVLLDAWEIVGAHKDYAPIGREELAALEPEAILIGHGHFDHAADVGYVAGRTGALVVGSDEICDTVEEDAAAEGNGDAFDCLVLATITESSFFSGTNVEPPPGTITPVKLFADLPDVSVLQHIHSAANPEEPGMPFLPLFDPIPYLRHPNTSPEELLTFLATLGDPQGGTFAYHFRVGDFTLLWHDSSGPITDGRDFGPEIQAALDSFPDCVDVHTGAILGFDQPFSGLRDPRLYVEHAHPKVFLPSHHDAWVPGASAGAAQYQDEWMKEMEKLEHPPVVDFLRDPEDYMKVRSYDVSDPDWTIPMAGSGCAADDS